MKLISSKTSNHRYCGKLIYYNKVFRIETNCPVSNGELHQIYFQKLLKNLKSDYSENIWKEDFYRYYRTGRKDKDNIYYRLGQVNYHDGLKSGVFEIDLSFSTYYDNKIAYIIANELLYKYIIDNTSPEENSDNPSTSVTTIGRPACIISIAV